ncbi:MAG: beta-propeller domain-containing protein, partial [Methanoregulaceae archaeon]|nr:beta-propeller domain-containing protein [Methanoregulaceae archaeon]
MKAVLLTTGIVLGLVSMAILGCIFLQDDGPSSDEPGLEAPVDGTTDFRTFSSYEEIEGFLKENQELGGGRWTYPNLDSTGYAGNSSSTPPGGIAKDSDSNGFSPPASPDLSDDDSSSDDYSTTNVQEQGVDEGDIVKNDGGHCYLISRDQHSVFILDAYPAEESRLVCTIDITKGEAKELYLLGDRLVILCTFSETYEYYYNDRMRTGWTEGINVLVYNIEDRDSPALFREDAFKGRFIDSRMIGSHFYLIENQYETEIDNETDLPIPSAEVQYIDEYDESYTFTSVASIDVLSSDASPNIRTMLLGYSTEVYVSMKNIYMTKTRSMSYLEQKEREVEEVLLPLLPDIYRAEISDVITLDMTRSERMDEIDRIMGDYLKNLSGAERTEFYSRWNEKRSEFLERIGLEMEVTEIHRISIGGGFINLKASGAVPGYILNRYSMGEYEDYFRIATTTGHVSREGEGTARNHVFILDMDLITVGN